jgi:ribosome recycling factor
MKSTQSRPITITPWTKSEVTLLEEAIEKSGHNWFEIAKQLPNRSPNQCA